MGKKQVAVSLRKPPSPEKVDAFVAGGNDEKPAAGGVKPKAVAEVRAHDEKPAGAALGQAPAAQPEAAQAESAQPEAAPAAAASAAVPPQPLATTSEPPAVLPPIVGADGRSRRAVTIYLPDPLADRLLLHCIEHDRDMSNLVGEAVQVHLDRRLGPASVSAAPAAGVESAARDGGPAGPSYRAEPFRAEPFRAADAGPKGRIRRAFQVGRALMALWRQRPLAS
ncbi:hypothetical protein [Sorangium sp. So ce131]|uniref:hypothetical protein n=1 Tax=Sorangium sp. So ce131 TaxID=3133282 RepID=UPI003F624098